MNASSQIRVDARMVMARIHGASPGGTVIGGLEVFRRACAAVGLGWHIAPTRWPGLRRLADLAYRTFARNRLRWTRRASACEAGHCQILRTHAQAQPAVESTTLGSGK